MAQDTNRMREDEMGTDDTAEMDMDIDDETGIKGGEASYDPAQQRRNQQDLGESDEMGRETDTDFDID
jgi:hypothetical protein